MDEVYPDIMPFLRSTLIHDAYVRTSSSCYGAVAEQMAVVELLRRGHRVAVPVVDDDGVDMVVNYGVTVQVKAACRSVTRNASGDREYGGFVFASKKGWARADVFLFCAPPVGHEDARWWVIPREVIGDVRGTVIKVMDTPKRGVSMRLVACENAWDVFDASRPS